MATPTVRINVSAARGESFADIARRTGLYGVLRNDTDAVALSKLNAAAEAAAAFVEGFTGPVYANVAAGEAATTAGQVFRVNAGGGVLAPYLRTSGGSTALAPLATSASLLSSDPDKGAALVGDKLDAPGAVPVTQRAINREAISLLRFGAVCDGVTDDSAAVQAAFDFCGNTAVAHTLLVPGLAFLASPVKINRQVDTTANKFRVVGSGRGAGFKVNGTLMFDSDLPLAGAAGEHPSCEFVTFERIRFEGAGNPASLAFSEKFLRMEFNRCEFEGIRCLDASIYAQEWAFERCVTRYAPGAFFRSQGAYWINSHGSKWQFNLGGIFNLLHDTYDTGAVGCSFIQDVIETNGGAFVRAGSAAGLAVSYCYTENSDGPFLDLTTAMGATNFGVVMQGNEINSTPANNADAGYYAVILGQGGIYTAANFCRSNFIDNAAAHPADVTSLHDRVATGKLKFRHDLEAQRGIVPDPMSAYAAKIYAKVVMVDPENAVEAHTVALPSPRKGMFYTVANPRPNPYTFSLLPSHSADGSAFRGAAPNATIPQTGNQTLHFACFENGVWDIVGRMNTN